MSHWNSTISLICTKKHFPCNISWLELPLLKTYSHCISVPFCFSQLPANLSVFFLFSCSQAFVGINNHLWSLSNIQIKKLNFHPGGLGWYQRMWIFIRNPRDLMHCQIGKRTLILLPLSNSQIRFFFCLPLFLLHFHSLSWSFGTPDISIYSWLNSLSFYYEEQSQNHFLVIWAFWGGRLKAPIPRCLKDKCLLKRINTAIYIKLELQLIERLMNAAF
jgi:hypothetical protein